MPQVPNFKCEANGDDVELMIYDTIGPDWLGMVSAKAVTEELNRNKSAKSITVRINSPGGSAFDGIAIHNALKSHPAKVTTVAEGIAASAASLVFMAGDERLMHKSAALMIHDSSGITMGNAKTHEKTMKELEKLDGAIASIYADKTGGDSNAIRELMDEDYWMYGEDAIKDGYATDLIEGDTPSAFFDLSMLNNVPPEIAERFGQREKTNTPSETENMTPDQFRAKHEDAVNDWINEGEIHGYAQAKTDLAAMLIACGNDKSAAFESFIAGKSVQQAKEERAQTLEAQLAEARARAEAAEAKAKALEDGFDSVTTDATAAITTPVDEDPKRNRVQEAAAKIKGDYARNAYIVSCGYDPKEFKFD